jgi:hypothetical protein
VSILDPFTELGLTPGPDLTDEQVRAAWRAIATAAHPDRPDGGAPARYAAASAAYAALRTRWGRGEAYADYVAGRNLVAFRRRVRPSRPLSPGRRMWRAVAVAPARIRRGRPRRLTLRILAAAILAFLVALSGAGTPAVAALITGIGTWLLLTSRADLAPPPGR